MPLHTPSQSCCTVIRSPNVIPYYRYPTIIGTAALLLQEQRHWDISAGERLDLLKRFCSHGLEHWGSDSRGVETTRRFLLEWLSYLCRYVPVDMLEVVPQRLHLRPPPLVGRSDLETLLCSSSAGDWVKISEMLLGPVPQGEAGIMYGRERVQCRIPLNLGWHCESWEYAVLYCYAVWDFPSKYK